MKNKILFILSFLLVFSCSRSDDSTSQKDNSNKYYVKFSINNVAKVEFSLKDNAGQYYFDNSNFEEHSSSSYYRAYLTEIMNININSLPIKPQIYNWNNGSSASIMQLTKFYYKDPQNNIQYSYMYSSNNPFYSENSNLALTVSQVTNSEVKATFTGKIVAYDTSTSPYTKRVFNITNGEIYMPIIKY